MRKEWMILGVAALIAVCAWASAQTLGTKEKAKAKTRPAVRQANSGFVSKEEARIVLDKVERITQQVILQQRPGRAAPAAPAGLATRAEIVQRLNRLFELVRPAFKYTPNRLAYDPGQLTIPAGDRSRPVLEKLIGWGCIGRTDPLASADRPHLTIEEFGDAVGYFMARIAELTHTPSTKYSPQLMGG